jgi:hypothetical protein
MNVMDATKPLKRKEKKISAKKKVLALFAFTLPTCKMNLEYV